MKMRTHLRICGLLAALLTVPALTVLAVPPSPELLGRTTGPTGHGVSSALQMISTADLHERGICTPDDFFARFLSRRQTDASLAPTAGTFKILAILVQFSDHPSTVAATFFDSLLFDASGGSTVKKYFNEISNTQIDLVTVNLPSSLGWNQLDSTYAYYVNGANGTGSYPRNSQKLVEDLVAKVNPLVDFSQYDNDGNGWVDCLLVIHSGTGAEMSGNLNDIWSHKWSTLNPPFCDGVHVGSYTVQPEFWTSPGDMTIGVYSHELCHGFGLPDLYDINTANGNSYGAGYWCIMAYGCWNGPSGRGGSPSWPCAWSRIKMGLTTATNVTSNLTARTMGPVAAGGTVYRLWTSGTVGNEYFLIENRQKILYDAFLPSSGLLIWHIDDNKSDNASAWWPGQDSTQHYLCALEQADGLFQLEQHVNAGNAGDPYPGSTAATAFNSSTTPKSNSYLGGSTPVAVNNISMIGGVVTADLIVGLASSVDDGTGVQPRSFDLAQNYPNPFNPSTVIDFELQTAAQVKLQVYNSVGQLVRTLFDGHAAAGTTSVVWDGADDYRHPVATGVYMYRLSKDEKEEISKKMLLLK
jgi:M6 family metalloprotease-like protein